MRAYGLFLTASALILSGATAVAQESNTDDGSLMADIVVTAQKKSEGENVQDVPIAITALGASQLDALNVRSLDDLNSVAPNAQFDGNSTFRGFANFSFRGAGVTGSSPGVEPAVGLFIDGVYQGVPAGSVSDNFDLSSIQILRGPQGTLFGRNVTGGAVLVETARPTGEFGGYVEASVETGPEYSASGALNLPISPGLNTRIAGYYRNDEGWFDNNFDGEEIGALETFIVRPTIELTSGPLTQTLILEYGDVEGDGAFVQNFDLSSFQIDIDERGFTDRQWYSATSETVVDVGFGNGSITNIFGYRDFEEHDLSDLDGGPSSFLTLENVTDQTQISDELRYAGTFGPVQLTTGLYYLHQELEYHEARPVQGRGGGGTQDTDTYGAFVQTETALSDRLSVIAGLRYSYEEKEAQIVRLLAGQCVDPTGPCDFSVNPAVDTTDDWDSLSPKLGVNYTLNPDVLFYASYSQSTRSGGYNLRISSPSDTGTFEPEDMTSFEVGMKADLLDHRLRANVSLFSNQYDDLQRIVSLPNTTQVIENSADARMQGVELELTMAPTDNLEIILGGGYLDAHYTEVRGDLNRDLVVNNVDRDLWLARASKWNATLGAIYTAHFDSGASLRSQLFYAYRSRAAALDDNSVFFPEYHDVRGDITYTLPNRATSISLFGRNLTDEAHDTAGKINLPFAWRGYRSISEGRSLGIEIRNEF